jgi:AcrR family transcriptional regulator
MEQGPPNSGAETATRSNGGHRDGRSTRWDPHRRERRATIVAAAIAAIEEHGPDALTGQIAERAGVPRTHVYRHFEGKAALDVAVSRQVARQIGDTIGAGIADTTTARRLIRGAVAAHLGWVEAHPRLYQFLAQHAFAVGASGSTSDDAKAVMASKLTGVLQHYLDALHLEAAPAERVIVGVVGMVDSTAIWWTEHHDVPRDELTAALTDQVWLVIDAMVRCAGLEVDPDAPLPVPAGTTAEPAD